MDVVLVQLRDPLVQVDLLLVDDVKVGVPSSVVLFLVCSGFLNVLPVVRSFQRAAVRRLQRAEDANLPGSKLLPSFRYEPVPEGPPQVELRAVVVEVASRPASLLEPFSRFLLDQRDAVVRV